MSNINSKPYLNEAGLGDYLKRRYSEYDIVSNKSYFKEYGHRFRPDYVIPELKMIYEFDGHTHYTSNNNVLNDIRRDGITKSLGYSTIRIPYFVQLDEGTINTMFSGGDEVENYYDFPHGFITDDVILPGTFSTLGANKFMSTLLRYYTNSNKHLAKDIVSSLHDKWIKNDNHFLQCFPISSEEQYHLIYHMSVTEIPPWETIARHYTS